MATRTLWFDRLRKRVAGMVESPEQAALPGLMQLDPVELDRSLENVEVFIIEKDVAERLIENGEAPGDLAEALELPFDEVFFQIEPVVELSGERGRGLRGILISKHNRDYRVMAWFEERTATAVPRYDFTFKPGELVSGRIKRITDLIYWLAAYVTSPNVIAVRHNRPHDLIKRWTNAGLPAPKSYYTFESCHKTAAGGARKRPGEPRPRVTNVRGHFRRAHWHNLPSHRGKACYPTTWVRSHKRRIPEPELTHNLAA